MMRYLILLFLLTSCDFLNNNNESVIKYVKNPDTNQCYAIITCRACDPTPNYTFKITAVDCDKIPDSLIVNKNYK